MHEMEEKLVEMKGMVRLESKTCVKHEILEIVMKFPLLIVMEKMLPSSERNLERKVGGVGAVIRDWKGNFIAAGARKREGIGTALQVELLAVLEGLWWWLALV